jgi:hypothetical protein
MDIKDLNELRSEFEELQKNYMQGECEDGSCMTDEDSREDYPDYLVAIYKEVMPPVKSGIYFSRWDLKAMAAELDEHFALDVRERMFKNFMQRVATPDEMKLVMDQFCKNIDMKSELYREYSSRYPASKSIFEEKIRKAENTKIYLDKVFIEFFS